MLVKSRLFVLAAVSAIILATTAWADSQPTTDKTEKKNVAVFVNKSSDDADAKIKLKINGEAWKFQLPTLSEGEERIIATEDGRTVKAKRTGKEVTIEAGGETVKVPVEGPGMHVRFHGVPPVPPVPPVHGIAPAELKALQNSIVISGVELSEEQQKKIREAIKKSGVDKPVKFVQSGKHMVLHGKGPMVWNESGDGSTTRTVMVVRTDGDQEVITEDVMGNDENVIKHDIEVIRKQDKDGDTQ